ncbi:hypothetical protein JCM10914A_27940 [Paenibacillus sp. JCM 10914]|uniref:hypothetical protein n=1 Tax=Paenibacillus sp. JCM 10914 TaxID=1236974 RepID=UPI0003CC38D2|nr:hypothetical protein [Paenibacillus sp. JCM 10914]GAE09499.1 hypothetical protein JCM10914_5861 [Paenibacillus sp. JCM 10914]
MEFVILIILIVLVGLMFSSRMTAMEKRMNQQQFTLNQIASQLEVPEHPVNEEVRTLLADGQEVRAIKLVREQLGLSLIEAKQYVDAVKSE